MAVEVPSWVQLPHSIGARFAIMLLMGDAPNMGQPLAFPKDGFFILRRETRHLARVLKLHRSPRHPARPLSPEAINTLAVEPATLIRLICICRHSSISHPSRELKLMTLLRCIRHRHFRVESSRLSSGCGNNKVRARDFEMLQVANPSISQAGLCKSRPRVYRLSSSSRK